MIEQLFMLNGESWDLEEMAHIFQEGAATVRKIEDRLYLQLVMEPGESDQEMLAEAEKTFNRMNAICLVQDERFRPPKINGITRRDPVTGKLGTIVYLQAHAVVRVGAHGTLTVLRADGTVCPREPTFGEKAFKIALTNEALREALRTYATVEHDWRGLYLVLETIQKGQRQDTQLLGYETRN